MQDRSLPFGNRHPFLAVLLIPFIVLAACVARIFDRPVVRTRKEVADTIENFLSGNGDPYDWDDFICGGKIKDPDLELIRVRCATLPIEFPPLQAGHYCSDTGFDVLRGFIQQINHNEA